MTEHHACEVAVIGGGPAGMTTALYTTRLGHRTAVFEREGGRHATVSEVHNLYGVSEAVSGSELARHAVDQLQEYGGEYHVDPVTHVRHAADADGSDAAAPLATDRRFVLESTYGSVVADRVVFATGFADVGPSVPELERFAGRGLHYCLHCDAFGLADASAFVLGHDDHAAAVAMLLLQFTGDVELLLDGDEPTWDDDTARQLDAHPVEVIERAVEGAFADDEDAEEPWLGGLRFVDGTERRYRGGFAMYGTDYNADLAAELGCELTEEGAIDVDDRQETSVDGAFAVGDVTHGRNQTVFALADGARAGLALHKDLREFPRQVSDGEQIPDGDVPAAPPDLRARMRLFRERSARAGLRNPSPRQ